MKQLTEDQEIFLTITKPTTKAGRGSFGLMCDVRSPHGKRIQESYTSFFNTENPFKDINTQYKKALRELKNKDLSSSQYEEKKQSLISEYLKLAEAVRDSLYKSLKIDKATVYNQDNYKLLDKFFNKRYAIRKTKDKVSAYNDYRRAIEALGNQPLVGATAEQIEECLAKFDNNQQRRLASKLNQILKSLKSDIEIPLNKKKRAKVKHLSQKDFNKVLSSVGSEQHQLIFKLLYYSGLRIGELFAIEESDFMNGILSVTKQMIRNNDVIKRKLKSNIQPTKSEENRRVVVFPEFEKLFKEWVKIDFKERVKIRDFSYAKVIKSACIKTFGADTSKHIVVHDLRHSFAINCLNKGLNISFVAQQLGNTITVAQEHYLGYDLTDESIQIVKKKLLA